MIISILMILGKKISLSSRMLLGAAFNLDTLKGLVQFLRRVFKGTFLVEGIGMLCFLPVFVNTIFVCREKFRQTDPFRISRFFFFFSTPITSHQIVSISDNQNGRNCDDFTKRAHYTFRHYGIDPYVYRGFFCGN